MVTPWRQPGPVAANAPHNLLAMERSGIASRSSPIVGGGPRKLDSVLSTRECKYDDVF